MLQPVFGLGIRCQDSTMYHKIANHATCFCEDHCSWRMCKLRIPPPECLPSALVETEWTWDDKNSYWIAKVKGNNFLISLIIIHNE